MGVRRPETVWTRITTVRGVNDELWPFLRMTAPASLHEHGAGGRYSR